MRHRGVRFDRTWFAATSFIVATLVAQVVFFPVPTGIWVRAVVLGLLTAMLAIGMALIYRTNRFVNFAQADLGIVPASFSASFMLFWGWPYLLALASGLVIAAIAGIIVEFALIRRFRNAPRLIVTVASLGIAQLMVVVGILIPRWWGANIVSERPKAPWDLRWEIGVVILRTDDIIALVVAPVMIAAVAAFLAFSRTGLAVRANAEAHERAAMIGLPVVRLDMIVWIIATVLAFTALFMRNAILGNQLGFAASLEALMIALAALALGRLERLPTIAFAAIAFTVLEQCVRFNENDSPAKAYPIVAAIVFAALLLQPARSLRRDDAASSWRGAEEVRPLPIEVRRHWLVSTARSTLIAAGVAVVVLVPVFAPVDIVVKATSIGIGALVALSLVVLTGWSGQISLGQMAFVAIGAAVSATLTSRWNVDLTLAIAAGGVAAAAAALVVGLPALRLRGLYLAVTTFAFGLVTWKWLLSSSFFGWFPEPDDRVPLKPLFGQLDIDTPTRLYAYTAIVAAVVFAAVRGVRNSRTGRAIIALRENERGAQAYSVPPVRSKLAAFTLSGWIAGVAGGLYVPLRVGFDISSYSSGDSLQAFTAAVVGGLGSLGGALLGAVYFQGLDLIRTEEWRALTTGVGVLLALLVLPGGLGGLWWRCRDWAAAWVVRRFPEAPPVDDTDPSGDTITGKAAPA